MSDYTHRAHDFAEGTAREKLREDAMLSYGSRSDLPLFYRYVVLETIFDPHIIDASKIDYWERDLAVSNIKYATVAPRNAIIARRIINNNSTHSENTMVLYPFLPPNVSLPCKPGEHVWVMFEDPTGTKNDLGYWMWRIVGPHYAEDVNHSHPHRAGDPSFTPGIKDFFEGTTQPVYEINNGVSGEANGQRFVKAETATIPGGDVDAYKKLMLDSDAGKLSVYERVPRFRKRPEDVVLEGSNNTLIVMGRERSGPVAEYEASEVQGQTPTAIGEEGSGAIDLVAGRGETETTGGVVVENDVPTKEIGKGTNELSPAEGDPDYMNDRSRVLISQRTNVDSKFNLGGFNAEFSAGSIQGTSSDVIGVEDNAAGDGAIVIKTDKIRLIARSDVEFIVTGFDIGPNGKMTSSDDTSRWSSVVMKANGDIIMRPAEQGYIKLGGDDADKGLVCTDMPVVAANGKIPAVAAPPLLTTMGGQFATGIAGQGMIATKILVVGNK